MIFNWLGIVVFAAVGIARSEVFEKLDRDPWAWYLVGLLAFAAARGRDEWTKPSRRVLLWLVPAVVSTWAWGALDSISAWLLVSAAISSLVIGTGSRWVFVPGALSTAGMVLLAQTFALTAYVRFGADLHAWPAITGTLAKALAGLGVHAGDIDGVLLVQHADGLHRFAPGFDQMGCLFAAMIAVGALPVLWLQVPRPWRALAITIAVLAAYMVARYLFLILTFRMHLNPTYLWRVGPQAATWLPCIPILARIVRNYVPSSSYDLATGPGSTLRSRWVVPASVAFGFLAVLSASFRDPGERKQGRVLFDELHSDWEWTDQRMGTAEFGLGTTYNYYNLYEHLGRYFDVARNRLPIDPTVLSKCDVLVLRTPTRAYEPSEIEAVTDFVEHGGGVWMIGDHTNVFGSAMRMNPLAETFGIHFRSDAEYDLKTGGLNVFEVPRSSAHPVVVNMPDFLCATGCTIDTDYACQPVMTINAVNTLPADYSQRSFFPREGTRQDFGFGIYTMCAAREYGMGRVLAFADSTVFSNFFMYIPGKPEFALGSIDWLNRTARFAYVPYVAAGCATVLALLLLALTHAAAVRSALPRVAFGILLGASLGTILCDAVTRTAYSVLSPVKEANRVKFDLEHSGVFLPIARLQDDSDNDYATFYTWSQRVDLVPSAHAAFDDVLAGPGLVVLADMIRPMDPYQQRALEERVRSGGNLLVIHGPRGDDASVAPLLAVFGFALDEARPQRPTFKSGFSAPNPADWPPVEEGTVHAAEPMIEPSASKDGEAYGPPAVDQLALAPPFDDVTCSALRSVRGGQPLVLDEEGEPVIAWSTHGLGRVIVVGCGEIFSGDRMGTVSIVPDPEHRQIYELAFALFRLGGNVAQPPLPSLLGTDFLATRNR